jgi:hypothetical protein
MLSFTHERIGWRLEPSLAVRLGAPTRVGPWGWRTSVRGAGAPAVDLAEIMIKVFLANPVRVPHQDSDPPKP